VSLPSIVWPNRVNRGVRSYFHKKFIKEGNLPQKLGKIFDRVFELRQTSDYRECEAPTHDDVVSLVDDARLFIDTIEENLSSR
jgi:uncharacterized protein (UPF0332 family)